MATKKPPAPAGKGAFYRLMRDLHGYASAFAFTALLLFAVTGVFLNHPGLTPGAPLVERTVVLSPEALAAAMAAPEPGRAIFERVSEDVRLAGAYTAGDRAGPDLFIRAQGVRGVTDLRANIETGQVQVTVARNSAVQVLNGLHTGELATWPWKLIIDIAAGVLIAVAVLGYILFFSLRFRLKTAIGLTALGLVAMAAVFFVLVP